MIEHWADGFGIGRQPDGDLRQRGRTSAQKVTLDVHQHWQCEPSDEDNEAIRQITSASGSGYDSHPWKFLPSAEISHCGNDANDHDEG